MNRARSLSDVSDLTCTTLHVSLGDRNTFDDDLIHARQGTLDNTGLSFILSG